MNNEELTNYLATWLRQDVNLYLTEAPKITNIAKSYWLAFQLQADRYGRSLQIPKVYIDKRFKVYFNWWRNNYELEMEITEKDSYYYFNHFRKDKSELIWEKHYEPLQPPYGIPTDIYNKVLLFTEEAQ